MFERAMTGLHAALALALAALALGSMLLGADFELLAARKGDGAWWFIGIWLVLSVLIALLPGTIVQWRAGLYLSAAALMAVALAGLWRGTPLAVAMAFSLLAVSMIVVFAARRIHARPPKPARPQAARTPTAVAIDWKRRICWWILALCMIEAFRLAHLGSGDAVKGTGSLGMLLAFFVMLPALSVSVWFPRLASAGWLLSALLFALMAWSASSASSMLGALLAAAGAVMLLRSPPQDADKSEMPQ